MKIQEKIITFLKRKRERMDLGDDSALFLNDNDITQINKWSDTDATTVWSNIKDIIKNGGAKNLGPNTCPFCYKHGRISYTKTGTTFTVTNNEDKCDDCSYGKEHGICYNLEKSPMNDFYLIYTKKPAIDSKFTNTWYKNTALDDIE